MILFNMRLPDEIQARLHTEAAARNCSKSDLAREAITAFFANMDRAPGDGIEAGDTEDDWSEFGAEVMDAQRQVFERVISKLYDAEWTDLVEPLYAVFRKKVIEKSKAYRTPAIYLQRDGEPLVAATIGFAADDLVDLAMPLDTLFYNYCVDAGDEAFDEIPRIWERVKARLVAESDGTKAEA